VSEVDIKHFLVIYDIPAGKAEVKNFETDFDAALAAYAAEEDMVSDKDKEVVLFSADSIETVRRTHSSYFDTVESFESLLPPGILDPY
jgi:hypothetical protein